MPSLIRKLSIVLFACFLLLFLWLIYLQTMLGPDLREKNNDPRLWSLENRIIRGGIYARGGEKIAESLHTEEKVRRNYPYGELYAHVVGYESRRLGKSGLEKAYDPYLLGLKGDFGKSLELRSGANKIEGNRLYLTIDHKLQKKAWELLSGRSGAVVMLDSQTGEILALVSSPGFDPNPENLAENWGSLRNSSQHPLLNRAVMGLYPPGSTLKIAVAAIGLQKIKNLEQEDFLCRGELVIEGRHLKDLRVHGNVNLEQALAVSCNCYFGTLGLRLGAKNFASGLRQFGFGERPPFELAAAGIPLPEDSFASANGLAEAAIGQGKMLASPLFMTMLAASFENDGVIMEPFLVKEIRSSDNKLLWEKNPKVWKKAVNSAIAETVREAMINAVSSGTGSSVFIEGVQVAGKTGTAENQKGEPHSWFVGFAHERQSGVAIGVLVEHGGQGSKAAAPMARELLELALK